MMSKLPSFRVVVSAVLLSSSLLLAGVGVDVTGELRTGEESGISDFFLSGSLHGQVPIKNAILSGYCTFGGRLHSRDRYIRSPMLLSVQERRTFLTFGLDGTYMATAVAGIYATTGIGYSWAWFKGLTAKAQSGWFPQFGAGFHFTYPDSGHKLALRLGYLYKDLQLDSGHGIAITIFLTSL